MSRLGVLLVLTTKDVLPLYIWIQHKMFSLRFSNSPIATSDGFAQISSQICKTKNIDLSDISIIETIHNVSVTDPRINFIYKPFGLALHTPIPSRSYGTFQTV